MDRYDQDPARAGLEYSIVVPLYNEAATLRELVMRLDGAMKQVAGDYQIVLVNDGSRDGTIELAESIAAENHRVVFVDLRRNFGQTAALQAGFDHAAGKVIVAMDGDLQHDPYDVPLLIAKVHEGYDIASGWRVRRADGLISRRLPSRMANWLIGKVSGVPLHDFGTTLKAYRREVLHDVRLYGDMHRYIPAICARMGAKICEVPIKNVRRPAGRSNYGIWRTFRVAMDLASLRFATKYMARPLHLFGKWGLLCGVAGGGILLYGLIRKLLGWGTFHLFQQHGPLMAMGFLLVLCGLLLLAVGLIGELLMRTYFESSGAKTYAVKRVVRGGADAARPAGGGDAQAC